MIGSFLKTVNLVLIDGINEVNHQLHVTKKSLGEKGKRQYAPIVDSDAVLRCKEVFVIVEECWDRNSSIYSGSKSSQGHGRSGVGVAHRPP